MYLTGGNPRVNNYIFDGNSAKDLVRHNILLKEICYSLFFKFCQRLFFFYYFSRVRQKNIPTAYLQRSKTPPTSVLDMTLNNLKVRL